MAKATIDLLAGNYPKALTASSGALEFIKKTVGVKYFKTLAIATLKAWCLVYNGKYTEAETLCSSTYKATLQALGRRHPQTLDAMGCLVHIFRCQGRFAEVIGTSISLDLLAAKGMEENVDTTYLPGRIHAKFQLSISRFANGEYATAELTLDDVVARAENTQAIGKKHPDTLQYKSEQARAALYMGNVDEAWNLAFPVVALQFELYTSSQIADRGMKRRLVKLYKEVENGGRPEQRLARVNELLDLVLRDASLVTLHAFLISTLQLVANIEVCKFQYLGGRADLVTARLILTTLHKASSTPAIVENAVLANSIALNLATLIKEENAPLDDLDNAVELFNEVYESRKSLL